MLSQGQWCSSGLIGALIDEHLYVISEKSRFSCKSGEFYFDECLECQLFSSSGSLFVTLHSQMLSWRAFNVIFQKNLISARWSIFNLMGQHTMWSLLTSPRRANMVFTDFVFVNIFLIVAFQDYDNITKAILACFQSFAIPLGGVYFLLRFLFSFVFSSFLIQNLEMIKNQFIAC